ncbi:MAG: L-dopachrome tautomerase-related protein [Rikenellaceae bacterium]
MRIKIFIPSFILLTLALCSCNNPQKTVAMAETIFMSDSVRASNLAITQDGRLFVSVNPMFMPTTRVYELKQNSLVLPYPDANYVVGDDAIIEDVIGIRTDQNDNLWLLDMTKKHFIVWDTKNEVLKDILPIPDSVIRTNSFLQDFVIDTKNNRVIIADMTLSTNDTTAISPAFIVMDIESGEAWRLAENHPTLMPEIIGGMALNPIAIDPAYNWVYFGALNGTTIYRAPLDNFNDNDMLIASIEEYGPKPFSDGIAVDTNQNVYVTNISDNAIGVTQNGIYRNIAMLPEGQSWPDGLYVSGDGYVYATVDQLDRTALFNNGICF